eukprot:4304935-Pleurochrysis_carterae.AAC.1
MRKVLNRERNRRKGEALDTNGKRTGGAGRGKIARPVQASITEEEIRRDIGAPQHTWGDGSCWLWAVAGALDKMEGKEGPTENDIKLERLWRREIQQAVREHGIPMIEEEINRLS